MLFHHTRHVVEKQTPGILVENTRTLPGLYQEFTRNPPGILVCNQDYQDSAWNTWGSGKFCRARGSGRRRERQQLVGNGFGRRKGSPLTVVGMPWRASSLSKREITKSSVSELGETASREMMKDSYDGGRLAVRMRIMSSSGTVMSISES
jgi:hypothetical protein